MACDGLVDRGHGGERGKTVEGRRGGGIVCGKTIDRGHGEGRGKSQRRERRSDSSNMGEGKKRKDIRVLLLFEV